MNKNDELKDTIMAIASENGDLLRENARLKDEVERLTSSYDVLFTRCQATNEAFKTLAHAIGHE